MKSVVRKTDGAEGAEPKEDPRARLAAIANARARRTRDKLEAIKRAQQKRLAPKARERLSEFVRQAWDTLHPGKTLEWNWHLDVICDHVQAMAGYLLLARSRHERGERWDMPAQKLLINVPPRSLKTEIVGVYFPAWLWLKDPSLHIRYVSGSEKIRTLSSRMVRDLIGSRWYRESFKIGWNVRPDADAIGMFETTARGLMYYSTYEQKVTGEGTDVMIIDDPLDAKKAQSEVERTSINTDWDHAYANRVKDQLRFIFVGIMQRLHEEDWSAHVLSKGWRHVCMPTEFERRDVAPYPCPCADCRAGASFLGPYDHRQEGELLHAGRMDARWLEEEKAQGSLYYAGQHQQRPAPAEGGMFKRDWWRYFDPSDVPRFQRTVIAVDCSYKKTLTGSRTSMLVVGEAKQYRYVIDNVTRSMDAPEMTREILRLRQRYPTAGIYIEEKAAGGPVIAELKARGVGNLRAFDPKHDSKESRAASIASIVEAGDVLLAKGAPWLDDFLHELSVFPNGKWDDQVDALSMALMYLRGSQALQRTKW